MSSYHGTSIVCIEFNLYHRIVSMILSTNLRSCGSVFVVRLPTCFENADFPKFYNIGHTGYYW